MLKILLERKLSKVIKGRPQLLIMMTAKKIKTEGALEDPFLNFKQAVEYLGSIPESTLREWTSTRKITSYRPGKQVRYRKSHLDEFMERHIKKSYYTLAAE